MAPSTFAAIVVTGFALLSACGPRGAKDRLVLAPVPEAARRLSVDIAGEGPQALNQALEQAVCLVLSSQVPECRAAPQEPDLCHPRTRAQVDSALRPTFIALRDTLAGLKLTSPSLAKAGLAARLPGAVVTDEVYDARRSAHCREWSTADGSCLAIRADSLWILLRGSPPPDGTVRSVEIFLAAPTPCTNRVT